MATVRQPLEPCNGMFRTSNSPRIVQVNGTNIPVRGLAFGADVEESVFFRFKAAGYGSGNLTVEVRWYADTATSGDVIWGAQIAAVTPDTDTQDVETDSLASAATATDTHLGTTGQREHVVTITVSSLDSLAAGDDIAMRFYRDGDAGGDTMTGPAVVLGVEVSWSDT